MANKTDQMPSPDEGLSKPLPRRPPRRRATANVGRRGQRAKRRGPGDKRRGQREKRRGQEEKQKGVTVKRTCSDGKRRWDKKHYCVFCRRPQVKIARHLLTKHAEQQEVAAASELPTGSKQRHLLLEHLRCRGNYMHNIEVIRQGTGEIVPWRQPSEDVDARNYLPCPLCLGFFLRADLWKHQASCRKKLTSDPSKDSSAAASEDKDTTSDSTGKSACDPVVDRTDESTEDPPSDLSGDATTTDQTGTSETGTKRLMTSDLIVVQNVTSDPGADQPRKRSRVQAAASRLLPISSGASESCSEVLHRMNQDHVSHQVKSDWLICKYGNKLMGNQDGSQRRYDYISQKLRELGRFLLAAKSLDSGVQNLQDLLSPGRLSLSLAAARKASGYRWNRPPLAVKTTLKTVCEIAIGESLQDGDWEAAAKTTDFYHLLGREWDNLGLLHPDPNTATAGGAKLKKRLVHSRSEKCKEQSEPRLEVSSQNSNRPPESRLQTPITVPAAPGKVQRRPWSSAEKEAVWRQLGVHVLVQSVPGKEVCQRCLDLEPVLRGRHWKDIKNQVHNQIQSQKKQQFHAQMDLQENQEQRDLIQNQKKQQQYQANMDQQGKDHTQNQKKQHYQAQMDHQDQDNIHNKKKPQYPTQLDHLQIHKKHLCHARLDHQDHIQIHKKQLYQMGQQNQGLQTALDRDTSILTGTPYGPDGSHQALGQSLLERDPTISPYSLPHRTLGPHVDELLSRTEWTDESLAQHYSISRQLDRNLLQDAAPGPPPNSHSGLVHF
ncbi:uncharacterized protein LOC117747990 isoform X2 [Cyclopterus lumpus]|uniref:uncharacterized protein LOC117747990 isoform X2 n=1 Tax=Cyclopterus lumpus TaxID=8103 RepID=UPI001486EEF1|nr:uncharacterized protein LOC117747990 isoform X2 [Cyclopterus lumpus]XP_034413446.1 uncharacterized protein LOC117747990 isoform X2 [Cyclopterus lumpus]